MSKLQYAVAIGLAIIIGFGGLFLLLTPTPTVAPESVNDLPIIDPSQKGQPTYFQSTPNDIVVTLPFPGAVTGKEFSVRGKARGYWFFEASFPVVVYDTKGTELAIGLATPEPEGIEWMTTEFVNFKADLAVPESYIGPAVLVLKKDNPSGLPEHDATVSFPFTIEY